MRKNSLFTSFFCIFTGSRSSPKSCPRPKMERPEEGFWNVGVCMLTGIFRPGFPILMLLAGFSILGVLMWIGIFRPGLKLKLKGWGEEEPKRGKSKMRKATVSSKPLVAIVTERISKFWLIARISGRLSFCPWPNSSWMSTKNIYGKDDVSQ